MELRQIRYFVAVAERLHFGKGAADLDVGQPAVSQQISRLERELGVPLFDRSSRSVRLTPAGQRFLPEARAVLAAVDRAAHAAVTTGPGAATRLLRLGSSAGLGDRLEEVLRIMRGRAPEIEVELISASTRARLDRVRAGQLDASFVRGVNTARGLELIPIWRDELVAALPASHPLAARDRLELADLAVLPLRIVSRRQNQPLVDLVMSACARAGFEPLLAPKAASETLQETLVAIGFGSPSWTVMYAAHGRTLRATHVVFRKIAGAELSLPTALAVRAGASTSALAPLLWACDRVADDDHGS